MTKNITLRSNASKCNDDFNIDADFDDIIEQAINEKRAKRFNREFSFNYSIL